MKIAATLTTILLYITPAVASDCPSSVTLQLNSTGYSGVISVELRKGSRPGSRVIAHRSIQTSGNTVFADVCAGSYFFAFSPTDAQEVNVTRNFDVLNDDSGYSNPTITVYYSRSSGSDSKRVGKAKRSDL